MSEKVNKLLRRICPVLGLDMNKIKKSVRSIPSPDREKILTELDIRASEKIQREMAKLKTKLPDFSPTGDLKV